MAAKKTDELNAKLAQASQAYTQIMPEEKKEDDQLPTFSARIDREVADMIKDYAFTKRILVGEALTIIVKKFFDDYTADPENEPLLKHKETPRKSRKKKE